MTRKRKHEKVEFRVDRKKFGFTYSQAGDKITSSEELIKCLTTDHGVSQYLVGREPHQDGGIHYHVWIKFDKAVNSKNPRVFDVNTIHPNIINPGNGWLDYCKKHGDVYTNMQESAFVKAREMETADAMKYLWEHEPEFMFKNAATAEKNHKRLKRKHYEPVLYYGPWPKLGPETWNPSTHTLIITGDPGIGKSQWVRYHCAHEGGYFYVKGPADKLKQYDDSPWIILDDIAADKNWTQVDYNSLLDIEAGGSITFRYENAEIPPGIKRIIIRNPNGIQLPYGPELDRRAESWDLIGMNPE